MRQFFIFFCSVCFWCVAASTTGQRFMPNLPSDNKLVIVHHDTAYVVHVTDKVAHNPAKEKIYCFVHHRELGFARGGYLGKLLHGNYVVYTNNTHLLEQGQFNKGLKNGQWKRWHPNGQLAVVEGWNNGKLVGKRVEYSIDGKGEVEYYYRNGHWQPLKKYARREKAQQKQQELIKIKTAKKIAKEKERQDKKEKKNQEKIKRREAGAKNIWQKLSFKRPEGQPQSKEVAVTSGTKKTEPKSRSEKRKDKANVKTQNDMSSKGSHKISERSNLSTTKDVDKSTKKGLLKRLGIKK